MVFTEEDEAFIKNLYLIWKLWTMESYFRVMEKDEKGLDWTFDEAA